MRKKLKTKRIYCAVFVHEKAITEEQIYCPQNQIYCCRFCSLRTKKPCRKHCVDYEPYGPCSKTLKRVNQWRDCPARINQMQAFLLALYPSWEALEEYLYPHKKVYIGKLK